MKKIIPSPNRFFFIGTICCLMMILLPLSLKAQKKSVIEEVIPDSGYINLKLILGEWESTDSHKSRIKFVESKSEIILMMPDGSQSCGFIKDSLNRIYTSGFIANWPPFNCELKMVSSDTLEAHFAYSGSEGEKVQYVRMKK